MEDDTKHWVGAIFVVAFVIGIFAFALGYMTGLKDGAVRVHTGYHIVTELPDGSFAVTRPKKP